MMGSFDSALDQQQIRHGYSLLELMENLDHEIEYLNRKRIGATVNEEEKERITRVKRSHLRKIQDCIQELESSGFNQWLMERQLA
ncbi:hypothetical protein [Synechococcus sp. MIT S1220]|uniref:hypothetical protein n=1 Tax=Synechococcus sp. MIT S1220 TaxID=3082549 RepID=UPI0039AEC51F